MARVHLLDDELINKIAAGEVVERPASVVKELVENAIDAGATSVRVCLKDGGRQLIEISDDGYGLSPEDAVMALKRHTTSKLRSSDQLFEVATMGFRGEALASISSVSRFTLQSMSRELKEGIRVVHEEGRTDSFPWQGSFGTTVTVKDLFYNVPARRNFLKTGAAEFAACHEYLLALALSLPQIGFRLLHNDREIFSVSALPVSESWPRGEQPLRLRTAALLGDEIAKQLLYIRHEDRHLKVEGLISAPGLDKNSAKHIYTYVNNRWVRDKTVRYAILRGYHSHILKGRFPVALLHADMEASLVDVNVHPAKAELRFQYTSEVQNTIAHAIRDGLRQGSWGAPLRPDQAAHTAETLAKASQKSEAIVPDDFDLLLPSASQPVVEAPASAPRMGAVAAKPRDMQVIRTTMSFDRSGASPELFRKASPPPRTETIYGGSGLLDRKSSERSLSVDGGNSRPVSPFEKKTPAFEAPRAPAYEPSARSEPVRASAPAFPDSVSPVRETTAPVKAPEQPKASPSPLPETKTFESDIAWDELVYVGAFQKCFLFFEHDEQLLVVDQHAFHERVLYERLLKNPDLLKRRQPLLMPDVLDFSPEEVSALEERKSMLGDLGFDFEVISGSEIEVKAVPSLLAGKDLNGVFASIIQGAQSHQEIFHDVLASVACHSAVRAGEDLPEAERKQLLSEAKTVDFYLNCPHGRRVLRWFKASQVAAWFDRLG